MIDAYDHSHDIAQGLATRAQARSEARSRFRLRWDRIAMLAFCLASWAAVFAVVRQIFF